MGKSDLTDRTKLFAIKVFALVNKLPKSKASDVVSYQLLKSSSSVAANYRSASRAKSRADFANKLKIVVEEADESNFWLEFIDSIQLLSEDNDVKYLIRESDELVAIFTKSIKTVSEKK